MDNESRSVGQGELLRWNMNLSYKSDVNSLKIEKYAIMSLSVSV